MDRSARITFLLNTNAGLGRLGTAVVFIHSLLFRPVSTTYRQASRLQPNGRKALAKKEGRQSRPKVRRELKGQENALEKLPESAVRKRSIWARRPPKPTTDISHSGAVDSRGGEPPASVPGRPLAFSSIKRPVAIGPLSRGGRHPCRGIRARMVHLPARRPHPSHRNLSHTSRGADTVESCWGSAQDSSKALTRFGATALEGAISSLSINIIAKAVPK